jgi:hypothetical protein
VNLGLLFDYLIAGGGNLGVAVSKEFQQLVAAIQAGWDVEHASDGTHTSFTSPSASIDANGNAVFSGTVRERGRAVPMGEWTPVAYSAGNYTAGGAMTWGVDDADETVSYAVVGKTMFLSVEVVNSDVGGVAATSLRLAIPGGYTCAPFNGGHVSLRDAGVWVHGFAAAAPDGTAVFFYRYDLTNYTITAGDNTDVRAVLTIPLT